MTASAHTRSSDLMPGSAAPAESPAAPLPASRDARLQWRIFIGLMALITALYLLLYNIYWVPGGDSELYVAAARSLAKGQGYLFNGQRVNISPPGWPLLLGGVMKISPYFATMKLVTLVCMVLSLGLWYWVLLRFARPWTAALITLTTALISHVYTLSFWMHSDALFLVVAIGAMLLAFQINESRSYFVLRLTLLLMLCAAAVFVRWAGVLQWPLLAGILLSGQLLPLTPRSAREFGGRLRKRRVAALRPNRQWIALILSLVVTVGAFLGLRVALALTPEEAQLAREAGVEFAEETGAIEEAVPEEASTLALINLETGSQKRQLTVAEQIQKRILDAGRWFSWLMWQPMRFVGALRAFQWVDRLFGWIIIACLLSATVVGMRQRQWLWPALTAYCAALCLNWPNPNARYLVPVAPLLIWSVVVALRSIPASKVVWLRVRHVILIAFVASVWVCNGMLYAIEVRVARSSNFYDVYEGGLNSSLIAACHYLNQYELPERRLGVSSNYQNLGRTRRSTFGRRAAVMLTEHVVLETQRGLSRPQKRRLRYWLRQDPISPWRVWHFRLPAWLQERLSGIPVERESAGWILYQLRGGQLYEVPVPPVKDWPTRVPGM
jgi:hypothetical protein